MIYIFFNFNSLENLNLLNFNTSKVINMEFMFNNCSSLNNLDISKFQINDNTNINSMFSRCSNDLKIKIKEQNKKINENAFKEESFLDSLSCSDSPLLFETLDHHNFFPIQEPSYSDWFLIEYD